MSNTPTLQRADRETILAWIRRLNDKAVKLTGNKPQVFEVGQEGTLLVADANLFSHIDQFKPISGLRPGIWRTQFMDEEDNFGQVTHWQFRWLSPGPLDLDNLLTEDSIPKPQLESTSDWEKVDGISVDSGKISLFDKDMLKAFIAYTGDERLVIDVCQDPFSDRMGYQGVLPGGFFTSVHDGGYTISARKHDGAIVELKVRESRKEDHDEDEDLD